MFFFLFFSLPDALLCLVPVSAFEDLAENDSISMLDRLKRICNRTEPEVVFCPFEV